MGQFLIRKNYPGLLGPNHYDTTQAREIVNIASP
jgi:hypothetical protein